LWRGSRYGTAAIVRNHHLGFDVSFGWTYELLNPAQTTGFLKLRVLFLLNETGVLAQREAENTHIAKIINQIIQIRRDINFLFLTQA
jgi:hypothetical protein